MLRGSAPRGRCVLSVIRSPRRVVGCLRRTAGSNESRRPIGLSDAPLEALTNYLGKGDVLLFSDTPETAEQFCGSNDGGAFHAVIMRMDSYLRQLCPCICSGSILDRYRRRPRRRGRETVAA